MTTVTRTRTYSPRPRDIERRWYVVDADGAVLGRLATEVAKILRGKHKPIFAPHMDTGDHVIVVNARGVRLTAGKESSKMLIRHSGFPGGLRTVDYGRLLAERPATAVERAVRGMLPKNSLGRRMLRKLAVYEGSEHPHQAQKPVSLGLGEIPRWEGLPKPAPKPAQGPEPTPPETEQPTPGSGTRRSGRSTGTRASVKAKQPAPTSVGGGRPARSRRTGGRGKERAPEASSASDPSASSGTEGRRRRRSRASGSSAKES
jgi:large subunit ribosomal protein L13